MGILWRVERTGGPESLHLSYAGAVRAAERWMKREQATEAGAAVVIRKVEKTSNKGANNEDEDPKR